MKKMFFGIIATLALAMAAPAMAQTVNTDVTSVTVTQDVTFGLDQTTTAIADITGNISAASDAAAKATAVINAASSDLTVVATLSDVSSLTGTTDVTQTIGAAQTQVASATGTLLGNVDTSTFTSAATAVGNAASAVVSITH